jgi:hypothetical protein
MRRPCLGKVWLEAHVECLILTFLIGRFTTWSLQDFLHLLTAGMLVTLHVP